VRLYYALPTPRLHLLSVVGAIRDSLELGRTPSTIVKIFCAGIVMECYILRNLKDVANATARNMKKYSVPGLKYSDLTYRIAATMSVLFAMMLMGVGFMPIGSCVGSVMVNL